MEGVIMEYYLDILVKLLLSAGLGALIGFEREHKNRPAGLRTNILVCVGATLVQVVSSDIFSRYSGIVNIDPARLGAQVISGIGFLGAGTIIREGASIKGLTTAASLWVVACIGLAIGNGSYIPGILTAVIAFLTLTMLKRLEERISNRNQFFNLEIEIENRPGQIGMIGQLLGGMGINIRNIEFKNYEGKLLRVYLSLKIPGTRDKQEIMSTLMGVEGIYSIEEV
jgi:putative Mg2+ transporter-C (MgtC) family protein